MAGYAIGFWGYQAIGEPIVKLYHGEAVMEKIRVWYDQYGFWGTLAAAVTPIPYKVFTIASGFLKFPFLPFLVASIIGRSFRFFVVAGVIYIFGPKVRTFIEKYFDWLAWALLILGVGGFLALKFLR
jgi:membrane protein YqaA with SNARE-associated domain